MIVSIKSVLKRDSYKHMLYLYLANYFSGNLNACGPESRWDDAKYCGAANSGFHFLEHEALAYCGGDHCCVVEAVAGFKPAIITLQWACEILRIEHFGEGLIFFRHEIVTFIDEHRFAGSGGFLAHRDRVASGNHCVGKP